MPAAERFKTDNILLPVLAKSSVYKAKGMARVLCGVGETGVQYDEVNFAADMRRLAEGVVISIPDDINGSYKKVRLKAYIIVVSADFCAAQSLLPFVESTRAYR